MGVSWDSRHKPSLTNVPRSLLLKRPRKRPPSSVRFIEVVGRVSLIFVRLRTVFSSKNQIRVAPVCATFAAHAMPCSGKLKAVCILYTIYVRSTGAYAPVDHTRTRTVHKIERCESSLVLLALHLFAIDEHVSTRRGACITQAQSAPH